MNKIYPYYGASGVIDYVESFIFDGDFILLGEDGENIESRVLPLAFRVSGKFWVNNHAHVFEARKGFDIDFLTELLEATDYKGITIGSAQPKITQVGLHRLQFAVPKFSEQVRISTVMRGLYEILRSEGEEYEKLKELKQGLMQDLLTGRVRVKVPEEEPRC